MGIHVGEAVLGGRDYTGIDVHRTARIAAAAWGGQVLISQAVEGLVGDALADGTTLADLGQHSLRDIAEPERLYQLRAPGLVLDFPPLRTATSATRTNLPEPLTRFVGRTRELLELRKLIDEARLVTLTGPGGTGKTRLAVETARRLLEDYPDGVFFVALESVRDPDLVLPAIGQVIGAPEGASQTPEAALAMYLAERRVLLVLDNLEQVVSAAPRLAKLLAAVPGTTILASSREPLSVEGEHVYPVPTLSLPSEPGRPTAADLAGSELVELFVERARTVRPDFELVDTNAPDVAAICRRLDGLPLAIELAAARVNLLPPAQILSRLDHRLGLVASARRDMPERQRTLRGAIDWSHDLLSEPERVVFRRFAVFAGGADLEAALAVIDPDSELAGDPLDLLAALVDRSLLRSNPSAAEARFGMLETIREYAAEQLSRSDEESAVRANHAAFFAGLAERGRDVLSSANRNAELDQLEREVPNLRTALAWSIDNDVDLGAAIASALRDFWRTRTTHLGEARQTTDRLIERLPDEPTLARAELLSAAAGLANWQADYRRANELTERSIAMLESLGETVAAGKELTNLGWANLISDPARARDAFNRSAEVTRGTDDIAWLQGTLQGLSLALLHLGQLAEAHAVALEAIEAGDRAADPYTNAYNYLTIGGIEVRQGELAAAAASFEEALRRMIDAGGGMGTAVAIDAVASIALARGEVDRAIRLAAVARRVRSEIGGAPSMEVAGVEAPLTVAERMTAPADYARALAEGTAMTVEEAIALAFEVRGKRTGESPDLMPTPV